MLNHIRAHYPWLRVLFVVANCTSFLQVCDVSINKPFKGLLTELYTRWRARRAAAAAATGRAESPLGMKEAKAAMARFVFAANSAIHPDVVLNGVRRTGLGSIWTEEGASQAIEDARCLIEDGSLWWPISPKDSVVKRGEVPVEVVDQAAADAKEASVGGKTRVREGKATGTATRKYKCSVCKCAGHTKRTCTATYTLSVERTPGTAKAPRGLPSPTLTLGRLCPPEQ